MAAAIGKLTIIIGAGIVGSALSKEAGLSDVASFFSGALKIVTRSLQQDKDSSRPTSKPPNDSLLAQVNSLRQELQLLASSSSVTIITGTRSASGAYSVTTVIVIGVVGYGIIWWKGWKLSDMMFVTRRGFKDACSTVGKQFDMVSSSISSAKRHLSSRLDRVDSNLDESVELTVATKNEVSKLHGSVTGFHDEVESVHQAVQTLETKLGRIEGYQNFTTRGIYHLCQFVHSLEKNTNTDHIKALPSSSQPALEHQESMTVARMGSLPSPASEPSSPSVSSETAKVLRPPRAVSASGIKEIQDISKTMKTANPRLGLETLITSEAPNVIQSKAPNAIQSGQEQSSSSSSTRFSWKLPSFSVLTRSRSAAT